MAAAAASTDFAQINYEVFEAVMREIEANDKLPEDLKQNKYTDTQKLQVKEMAETKRDWAQISLMSSLFVRRIAMTTKSLTNPVSRRMPAHSSSQVRLQRVFAPWI